ncbi:MAG: hypothetical protein ACJAR0_004364 [Candidatus Azotimanducaceae bacterium]|jgi:hypothetical protein
MSLTFLLAYGMAGYLALSLLLKALAWKIIAR